MLQQQERKRGQNEIAQDTALNFIFNGKPEAQRSCWQLMSAGTKVELCRGVKKGESCQENSKGEPWVKMH